eukprot:TRINITY_DN3464_c0_g1_i4.p1 TRINITY_DN3464_c0_g1~~TRINITY_DN3464_c0_g1_i4.p1  ORF type:complete len:115 (-),score=14.55 TRINITY_DN3464_c0_g1_i4:149-493(-)
MYKKHQVLLTKVAAEYGVQARFIVALWGLETNFGKIMGNYNVISALSTLAYEGRREVFFKKQLWAALKILQEGHIDIANMKGSWAVRWGKISLCLRHLLATPLTVMVTVKRYLS